MFILSDQLELVDPTLVVIWVDETMVIYLEIQIVHFEYWFVRNRGFTIGNFKLENDDQP